MFQKRPEILLLLLTVIATVWASAPEVAEAHSRSTSYSTWLDDGGDRYQVNLRLTAIDESALMSITWTAGSERLTPARYYPAQLVVEGAGCAFEPATFRQLPADAGWKRYQWSVACDPGAPRQARVALLIGVVPRHTHFLSVHRPDGASSVHALREGHDVAPLTTPSAWASGLDYVVSGAEHVLSGWDHLLFLLALLLGVGTTRELLITISGFTLGHSLSLGAAVLGWVAVDPELVELAIAASILIVVLEGHLTRHGGAARWGVAAGAALAGFGIVRQITSGSGGMTFAGLGALTASYLPLTQRSAKPERLRAGIALLFGLIHGFGFASALETLHLSATHLATTLLTFNIGVELGQLMVIAPLWPACAWLQRSKPTAWSFCCGIGGALCASLATYWLIARF